MLTSAFIAAATTLLTISISFMAAYSFARARFRHKGTLVQGLLILASLPVVSYVIPLRGLLLVVHLYDTLPGIILSETAFFSPLAAYIIYGYLGQLSTELEDVARLEESNLSQLIRFVVVPSIESGLAATSIIIMTLSWNQLMLPMVLTGMHVQTIPVMLSDFFTYERELEWGSAAAALIISLTPLIIFVFALYHVLEQFRFNIWID